MRGASGASAALGARFASTRPLSSWTWLSRSGDQDELPRTWPLWLMRYASAARSNGNV
jgi:hypothetical protein